MRLKKISLVGDKLSCTIMKMFLRHNMKQMLRDTSIQLETFCLPDSRDVYPPVGPVRFNDQDCYLRMGPNSNQLLYFLNEIGFKQRDIAFNEIQPTSYINDNGTARRLNSLLFQLRMKSFEVSMQNDKKISDCKEKIYTAREFLDSLGMRKKTSQAVENYFIVNEEFRQNFNNIDGRHLIHLFKRKVENCDMIASNLQQNNLTKSYLKLSMTDLNRRVKTLTDEHDGVYKGNIIHESTNSDTKTVLCGSLETLKANINNESVTRDLDEISNLLSIENIDIYEFEAKCNDNSKLKEFQNYFLKDHLRVILYKNLFPSVDNKETWKIYANCPSTISQETVMAHIHGLIRKEIKLNNKTTSKSYVPLRGYYNTLDRLNAKYTSNQSNLNLHLFITNTFGSELKYLTLEAELVTRLLLEENYTIDN